MVKIVEMDERITLDKQLDEDVGPIVMMNKFNVYPQEVDEFMQVFGRLQRHSNSNLVSFQPSCIAVLVEVLHLLIMSFGNLQDTLNRHLIDQSLDRIWPVCCPIR
jgi:hypothetical protein